MTLRQIEYAKAACRHQRISVQNLAEDSDRVIRDVVSWATETQSEPKPLLIYTSETVEGLCIAADSAREAAAISAPGLQTVGS
jgi:uncharacterized protein YgbK (DUF1537 family)